MTINYLETAWNIVWCVQEKFRIFTVLFLVAAIFSPQPGHSPLFTESFGSQIAVIL